MKQTRTKVAHLCFSSVAKSIWPFNTLGKNSMDSRIAGVAAAAVFVVSRGVLRRVTDSSLMVAKNWLVKLTCFTLSNNCALLDLLPRSFLSHTSNIWSAGLNVTRLRPTILTSSKSMIIWNCLMNLMNITCALDFWNANDHLMRLTGLLNLQKFWALNLKTLTKSYLSKIQKTLKAIILTISRLIRLWRRKFNDLSQRQTWWTSLS